MSNTYEVWESFLKHFGLTELPGTDAYFDALLDSYAHELAEDIRETTQRLKNDGVLEPDQFRPCRDAANQIDPLINPETGEPW